MKFRLYNNYMNSYLNGGEIKCLKDGSDKFIVPTKDWLIPLKDINTRGLLIESLIKDLKNEEKIVVKITKNNNKNKLRLIYKLFSNKINIIKSFCVFNCNEDESILEEKYKNNKSFCNSKDDNNIKITLDGEIKSNLFDFILPSALEKTRVFQADLMKYYKEGSLNQYVNKLTIKDIKKILKQLLYCQLELFNKYGFLHNDIHLGNILLYTSNEKTNIKYNIQKQILNIDTKHICLLCDFDDSIFYKKEHYDTYDKNQLDREKYNKKYTIFRNIVNIFSTCKQLLKFDEMIKYDKIINNKYFIDNPMISYEKCQDQCNSYLAQYYNKTTEYDIFINDSLDVILHYIYIIWKDLYPDDIFIDRGI
jgi:hypothetical protein